MGRTFREWKTESLIRRTGSVAASTISVCAWIFLMSCLAISITRLGHRDLEEIHEIVGQGMTIVDEIERYGKSNGLSSFSSEISRKSFLRTSCGYFEYTRTPEDEQQYSLSISLGGADGFLDWNETRRVWTTRDRVPWNLKWSEDAARKLGAIKKPSYNNNDSSVSTGKK